MDKNNIVEVKNLSKEFINNNKKTLAVDAVSLCLQKGEKLAIVGKIGCGKSTLAKILLRLIPKSQGEVLIDGVDIYGLKQRELAKFRAGFQYIFQNPYRSLNPKKTVLNIVGEAAVYHKICKKSQQKEYVVDILNRCELSAEIIDRFPKQLSGGQCQKVAIARALSLKPKLIICDEITSSIDEESKKNIINLIDSIHKEYNMSIIYITHDLASLNSFINKVATMENGRIVRITKM
jgi:ABC-type glutathione transport system ATPase component